MIVDVRTSVLSRERSIYIESAVNLDVQVERQIQSLLPSTSDAAGRRTWHPALSRLFLSLSLCWREIEIPRLIVNTLSQPQ